MENDKVKSQVKVDLATNVDLDDPMDTFGGYADCCGATEAEPTCEYRPPSPELVAEFAGKGGKDD